MADKKISQFTPVSTLDGTEITPVVQSGGNFYANIAQVLGSVTTAVGRIFFKAGSATAGTAPIKLTSGVLNTSAEAGAVEFNNDDFYATITTANARKKIALVDGSILTSGKLVKSTTNGRLTDADAGTDYQAAGSYELTSNKVTTFQLTPDNTHYPSEKLIADQLAGKQATGNYEVTTNKETSALDTSTTKYPCNNVVTSALALKQTIANKVTAFQITPDNDHYPSEKLTKDSLDAKQATLVSGTSIKTINSTTLLGSGNITVSAVVWKGAYNAATDYIVNDAVSYLGSSYLCILATKGNLPTNNTYWDKMASMGDPGVSGVSGALTTPFTAQTSVTVTHNFNAYPAVQVIDNTGKVIIPLEITHASTIAYTVTFSTSTSGNIVSTIGGVNTSVATKSGSYSILSTDNMILVSNTATITLPDPAGLQGKTFTIKHIATSGIVVTVNVATAATIDGQASWLITAKYTTLVVFTDGSNYFIV
jgi:hypothetical protein